MGTTASKDEDDVNFTPKGLTGTNNTAGTKTGSKHETNPIIANDESSTSSKRKEGRDSSPKTETNPLHVRESNGSEGSGKTVATVISATSSASVGGNDRETTTSTHVPDDQVRVNLAMADLMAYLQVVANNSANLPLTRRDDPDLGRTVSTLTADEYAKKSSAFIPSDVRIIGGTFLKYGRVWDLPTSEEFNPSDGAQEPGLSHGGACSNALLKVLYDSETDAADAMTENEYMNPENLFDDDDTGSCIGNSPTKSFESLVLDDCANSSAITWAELLRKMKTEMNEVGHSQVPTISSSRKFDLNRAFSLVPENFDSVKNRKRSLLIGCNYTGTPSEIKATHDDVRSIKDYIVNVHGFPETKGLMTVLLDDDDHKHPTNLNIIEALKALSEQSQPGDAIFIQFSGHGGRVLDSLVDSEGESYSEVIVPTDISTSGLIRDTLIFKTLLAPMRYGVTVTVIVDACDTGVMLDLPYSWSTKTDKPDTPAKMSLNDNFSFVRFLKVVKSLYETSTFTQLGRTVGSALNEKAPVSPTSYLKEVENTYEEDDDSVTAGSLMTVDENEACDGTGRKTSLMKKLAECYTPSGALGTPKKDKLKNGVSMTGLPEALSNGNDSPGLKKGDDTTINTNRSNKSTTSIFRQVLNCTLTHNEEESDEDTFNANASRDEFDHTFDDTVDFRTMDSESGTYEDTDDEDLGLNKRAKAKNRSRR